MATNNEPPRERHALDDAIDRVVRDMTRVDGGDDAGVARVMARVHREADKRAARDARGGGGAWPWLLSPRAAWSLAGAAALVLAVVIAGYWMRQPIHDVATTTPTRASNVDVAKPPIAVAEESPITAPAPPAAVTTRRRQPTHRNAASTIVATSIVDVGTREASDEFHSDLSPQQGDLAATGIAPVPLAESPALTIEPLVVDAIDPSPITVPPPVGPQR